MIRNPNGYGSVVKLSGNRRRPYAARKTVGWDDRAFPIYAVIGYYSTRKEAMLALAEYNANPYDIDLSKVTFKKLFEQWSKDELPKLGTGLQCCHRASFKHCQSVYDMQYRDIRKRDMQRCIDECERGYSTKSNIKNLFVQLDRYAYDNDIIQKCYSVNLELPEKETKKEKVIFTDDEVLLLEKHTGEPYIDETLFMLYTGCRVTEMLTMKCADIDLTRNVMTGGIKTEAGKNRIIPIHPKLLPIVQEHLSEDEFLFSFNRETKHGDANKAIYNRFNTEWLKAMSALGLSHTTHECRHTVRSKLDSAGANKVCIDLIIGHKSQGIGERVYTHKTLEELQEAMQKLVYGSAR